MHLACVLSEGRPKTTCTPDSSIARAHWMLARSSKRALTSTRQTACLPRSEARIRDGTSGESSLVRYTVCLIASTSGSDTACSTKRSTDVENESYG